MYKSAFKEFGWQVMLLVLLYFITRLLFLLFNYSYFASSASLGTLFFYGLRFDLAIIFLLNGLLFAALFLPFNFVSHPNFKLIYRILFVFVNALALLFNCIDIGYFEFTQKRSTFDLFQTLSGANDGIQVLPNYIADYWHLLLIWLGLVFILIRYSKSSIPYHPKLAWKQCILYMLFWALLILPSFVVIGRGGWQYRPIDMITAAQYAEGKQVALVLNTPFCIIKSANKSLLESYEYFDESTLSSIYNPIKQANDTLAFTPKNVVLIIMESIGAEYTALASPAHSLTPVLDSLAQLGTNFTQAFANGKTSIKGIPAVVAGLPTLFDGSFTYSAYNSNTFESLPSALRKKNYNTSFFHGGNNGTMGFDVFAKAAGFNAYYGRNEYPNNDDYDQHWGIYDEPFFQFFKQKMDAFQAPFMTCFFSLSSHHPYSIPEKYTGKFKRNELDISGSVQYADYALGKFFDAAKKSEWYGNTIFVITADHTSMSDNPEFQTDVGIYRIPILIFEPSALNAERIQTTIQQIDIMPTLLQKLHYNVPYFAFGESAFNLENKHYAVSFNGQLYQLISDSLCLQFNGEKTIAVYNRVTDTALSTNLITTINKQRYKKEENYLKALVQTYNNALIENKMTVSNN